MINHQELLITMFILYGVIAYIIGIVTIVKGYINYNNKNNYGGDLEKLKLEHSKTLAERNAAINRSKVYEEELKYYEANNNRLIEDNARLLEENKKLKLNNGYTFHYKCVDLDKQ